MTRIKMSDVLKMEDKEIHQKLYELNSELIKLKSDAARGLLKKEVGYIKHLRRNIARVNTALTLKNLNKQINRIEKQMGINLILHDFILNKATKNRSYSKIN